MHRAAFTILYAQRHGNFKHANAQAFTQTGLYTQRHLHKSSSHRCGRCFYTEAFEHRCLLHTQAFTQRCFDTYTPIHTKAFRHILFSENHRSFDTEKPLHRESFTHRRFYTHTSFSTEAFTQRSFYAQELLHTDAFTEAFAQRSLYTQTLSHRKTDSTEQLLHALINRNLT